MIISGKARLAGLFGHPVGHSLSPRLHGYWLREMNIDGTYIPLNVTPADFPDALRMLPRLGFAGCNVTLPHKEAALATVDRADELARRIGAVNTVVVEADGRLTGSNTDAFGFLENLYQSAPGWRADAGPALVLGAGGAARAVCAALQDAGAPEIRLTNRTRARAEAMADHLNDDRERSNRPPVRVVDWDDRAAQVAGAGLLVNTTNLGMAGQPPLDMDLDRAAAGTLVTDIVYTPLETPLLAAARERGLATVDGLGMLLHQARAGFRAWFGVEPVVDDGLRAFVLEALKP